MKKQFLLVVLISVVTFTNVVAQKSRSFNSSSYKTALGVKVYPGSITLKHFIREGAALEALGSFWERGARLTGLYEFHWDIKNAPGLKWYVGPGVHLGFYNDKFGYNNKSYVAAGIDGVLGLDYKFKMIPLNLSVDWQPTFEFGSNYQNGFGANYGGIAARYTF